MENNTEKKGFNIKILLIGLPIFIIQLVIVYFITANILLSKYQAALSEKKAKTEKVKKASEEAAPEEEVTTEEEESEETPKKEIGKNIYNIDDLIVNPANTNGQKLLLVSIGIDFPTKEMLEKIKEKEVVVKDVINGVLSSKTVEELDNYKYRDSLKAELIKNIKQKVPKTKINDIYFPKFIIQ